MDARSVLAGAPGRVRVVALPATGYPLSAQIAAAGHELIRSGYDWDGRRRGGHSVLLQYTLAGEGRLRTGRDERAVHPGQLMVLTIPGDHRYWLPPGGAWEHCWLMLHGREAQRAAVAAIARHGTLWTVAPTAPLALCIADAVQRLAAGLDDPFSVSALAYGALMALLSAGAPAAAGDDAAIARAVAHARAHLRRNPGVAELSRLAGISRWHFSRRFLAATGRSPAAFVAGERLRVAAIALADGASARDAALAAGFDDASYFGRAFRRAYGCTPGAFAARARR